MVGSLAQGFIEDTAGHRVVSRIKINVRTCQVSSRRPSVEKREIKARNWNSAHLGCIFHL